jgi:polyribonucleotide nucleotidyltransferase
MGFDERGKVRLSMKVVDQKTGKEIVREKKQQEDGEDNAA